MLKPLDRHRRDSTLFQFTTRRLRDFVDPDHPLIRIDEQFDFGKLVASLDIGTVVVHLLAALVSWLGVG